MVNEEDTTKVAGDCSDRRHAASHFALKTPTHEVAVECAEQARKVGGKNGDRRLAVTHLRLELYNWAMKFEPDWASEKCWRLALER